MKPHLAIALAVLCAIPSHVAFAKDKPAFVDTGRAYRPLRHLLWKSGWHVAGFELRHDGSCPASDKRCTRFTEAIECSGTGLGFCNMAWRHKDGTLLTIVTAGEKELTVHHWELK